MEILHPYPRWEKINLAAMGLTAEIEQIINRSLNGADVDGNGSIGNTAEEIGLQQMRQQLVEMLARENPPYQPIGRRYLLGLVKLPSGRWFYSFEGSRGASYSRY